MGEKFNAKELQERLSQPFREDEIEWRVMQSFQGRGDNAKNWAKVVPYVESRAIQNRLDEVLGLDGWENEYKEIHQGIICGIRIWFSENRSITKWDGADLTNFEATKGGISNSFKRAAVQWGIGRYLYNLSERVVEIYPDTKKGKYYFKDNKSKVTGSWDPPMLPNWALPKDASPDKNGNMQTLQGGNKQNNQQPSKQQNNQQRKPQGSQQTGRNKIMTYVNRYEKMIGLKKRPDYVLRIFNKATNANISDTSYIGDKATLKELEAYCRALKPVNDICEAQLQTKTTREEMLKYCQIIKPENVIKELFSLFFILTNEDVKKIRELAEMAAQQRKQMSA